ncbi:MAG: WxL domain-containing protein [Bacillota bacterium]
MKKLVTIGMAVLLTLTMSTQVFAYSDWYTKYDFSNGLFDKYPGLNSDSEFDNMVNNSESATYGNGLFFSKGESKTMDLTQTIHVEAFYANGRNGDAILTFYKRNADGEYIEVGSGDSSDYKSPHTYGKYVPIDPGVEADRVVITNSSEYKTLTLLEMELFEDESTVTIYKDGLFDNGLSVTSSDDSAYASLLDNDISTGLSIGTKSKVTLELSNFVTATNVFLHRSNTVNTNDDAVVVDLYNSELDEVVGSVQTSQKNYQYLTVDSTDEFDQLIMRNNSSLRSQEVNQIEVFGNIQDSTDGSDEDSTGDGSTGGDDTTDNDHPTDGGSNDDGSGDDNSNGGDTSSEEDVDLGLEGGNFFLETTSITSFGNISLGAKPKTVTTSIDGSISVTDLRGTQEGWRLDATSTNFKVVEPEGGFKNGTSAHELPVGSLSISPFKSITQVNGVDGGNPTISLSNKTILDDGTVTVAEASSGEGTGVFDLQMPTDALSLVIDTATAKVDNVNYPNSKTPYKATITWNLVSAP